MGQLALSVRLGTIFGMVPVNPAKTDALTASTPAPRPALSVDKAIS